MHNPIADRTRLTIRVAATNDMNGIRQLLHDYADWLGSRVTRRDFERELSHLPGDYAPPIGALLIADENDAIIGCIGLRRLDDTACELKRLYVRPDCRGRGLGRKLTAAAIAVARELGYGCMRLDLVPGLTQAEHIYAALGFNYIPPYYDMPRHAVRFMQLDLD